MGGWEKMKTQQYFWAWSGVIVIPRVDVENEEEISLFKKKIERKKWTMWWLIEEFFLFIPDWNRLSVK